MSDTSRHTVGGQMKSPGSSRFTVTAKALNGRPTLRVAYFFSGIARKASIGNSLKKLCEAQGIGLNFEEIDIQVITTIIGMICIIIIIITIIIIIVIIIIITAQVLACKYYGIE